MDVNTSKFSPVLIKNVDSAVSAVFARPQYLDKGVDEFKGKLGGFSEPELIVAIGRFEYRTRTGDNTTTASVACINSIIDELSRRGSHAIENFEEAKKNNLGKIRHMTIEMVKNPENQRSFESLRGCARSLDNAKLLFESIGDYKGAKDAEFGFN